jgi:hypothetical protein
MQVFACMSTSLNRAQRCHDHENQPLIMGFP